MEKFVDNIKKGFDVAVTEAEKLTRAAADKTSGLVDTAKLRLALSGTENKLSRLYENIGKIVYESGEPCGEEVAELCREVAEFRAEADKIRERLAGVKGAAVCPSCGAQNTREADFCQKCGARLADTDDNVIEVTDFEE